MNMQYTKRIVTLIAGVAALGLATTAQAGLKEDLAEAASTFAVSRQHYLQAQQELGQALGVKADVTKKLAEAQKLTGSKNKKDQDKASALTAEAKKEIDAAMATAGALSDKQKEHLQNPGLQRPGKKEQEQGQETYQGKNRRTALRRHRKSMG